MPKNKYNAYPVLLAGGTGTRLWPVSRDLCPKQLVSFIGNDSLIQNTIKRLSPVLSKEKVTIVCGMEHSHEIARHMEQVGVKPDGRIISEPCGRNTAPAILLAVLNIIREEKDPCICVFPADHVIKDKNGFHEKIESALFLAQKGYIVTFGIKPKYPETGYGYIEGERQIIPDNKDGKAFKIRRFVEKPDLKTAEKYVEAGNFFWNSGMFAFKASVIIEEFKKYQIGIYNMMTNILSKNRAFTQKEYESLPDISIDYAIMEKTNKGIVLPSDFGWSDIGSWKSLYDFLPKDKDNNVINGDVYTNETRNCFILGHKRLIATNHLNNTVVVETPDSIFVSDIENSRNVKSIVAQLKKGGRTEYYRHRTVHHPWGKSQFLDEEKKSRIKRLTIYPDSTYKTKTDAKTMLCVILTKGVVEIYSKKTKKTLTKGDQLQFFENDSIKIENKKNEDACIVTIEIDL